MMKKYLSDIGVIIYKKNVTQFFFEKIQWKKSYDSTNWAKMCLCPLMFISTHEIWNFLKLN